jgi:DNA-binding cell septation regulator SpoVG
MSIRSAAIAVGFVDRPDWPRMRLLDFRPMRKGKLLGFARVELPISLRIRDTPILAGPKGVFAALPAKPIPDGERRQKREVANGYLPCGRQVRKDTYAKKTIRAHLARITGG